MIIRWVCAVMAVIVLVGIVPRVGAEPLRIEITDGVQEPLPYAVPDFVPENGAAATPDRRSPGTGAGSPRSLLPPRLTVRTVDLAAGLGLRRPGTRRYRPRRSRP